MPTPQHPVQSSGQFVCCDRARVKMSGLPRGAVSICKPASSESGLGCFCFPLTDLAARRRVRRGLEDVRRARGDQFVEAGQFRDVCHHNRRSMLFANSSIPFSLLVKFAMKQCVYGVRCPLVHLSVPSCPWPWPVSPMNFMLPCFPCSPLLSRFALRCKCCLSYVPSCC